jgi:predicted acylesterase/phospholipase RssA
MNVYLSGGGLKGAYQYGFFKRIYTKHPHFPIDKIYCTSVGSFNALPIMTNRVDYLKPFWECPKENPLDKILTRWDDWPFSTIKYKTLYSGINLKPVEIFWDSCTPNDIERLKNVTIVSYNNKTNKPVFRRCVDKKTTLKAIETTCCYPGLYPPNRNHPNIIDGSLIKNMFEYIPMDEPWLCLDLHEDTRSVWRKNSNQIIFKPVNNSFFACLDGRDATIRMMIENGEYDADVFLDVYF